MATAKDKEKNLEMLNRMFSKQELEAAMAEGDYSVRLLGIEPGLTKSGNAKVTLSWSEDGKTESFKYDSAGDNLNFTANALRACNGDAATTMTIAEIFTKSLGQDYMVRVKHNGSFINYQIVGVAAL